MTPGGRLQTRTWQPFELRKLDALRLDMVHFYFVGDIYDGVFENFNPLK
jgi:hypothetical protein